MRPWSRPNRSSCGTIATTVPSGVRASVLRRRRWRPRREPFQNVRGMPGTPWEHGGARIVEGRVAVLGAFSYKMAGLAAARGTTLGSNDGCVAGSHQARPDRPGLVLALGIRPACLLQRRPRCGGGGRLDLLRPCLDLEGSRRSCRRCAHRPPASLIVQSRPRGERLTTTEVFFGTMTSHSERLRRFGRC